MSCIRASSALLRIARADSRYVNARFQRLAKSICGAVEGEPESRPIPVDEEGEGGDTTSVAWPRALSEYGASWVSCFDGGLTTIASSTELAVSLASSEPTSCDSETAWT